MRYGFLILAMFGLVACETASPPQGSVPKPSVVEAAPPPPPSPYVAPAPVYVQPEVPNVAFSVPPRAVIAPVPENLGDQYPEFDDTPVKSVAEDPVSTFSVDVDTASYAVMRRDLNAGRLPRKDAVRIEELINYFPYDYPAPDSLDTPFATHVAVVPTPWNAGTRLLHIGLKGYSAPQESRPRANIVLLIDVSGSMEAEDKLPLLKRAFLLLLDSLEPEDSVAIVTYAGSTAVVLPATPVSEKRKIVAALRALSPGGGTAGGAGLQLAYEQAEAAFDPDGINRIFLATDGDFNVGAASPDAMEELVTTKRESGVFLSVLGFGVGNYNDSIMQALAQNGNGTAAYIDTLSEARKVLVADSGSALIPIASDVKVQVEFNPARIAEYRLIGYETRALDRADFNNDKVDAGDINSGHTVTAIYEITPVGSAGALIDPLRYGTQTGSGGTSAGADELAFVKLRYKRPGEDVSTLVTRAVTDADALAGIDAASEDIRFSTAVAGFGQILRGSDYIGDFGYDDAIALAGAARGADPFGYRAEFLSLARLARDIEASN